MNAEKIKIPAYIIGGIAIGILCTFGLMSLTNNDGQDSTKQNGENINVGYSSQPYIPDEVTFCGTKVPIDNFDVYESLDYELVVNMYRHSSTISYLKKAKRYFPEIEEVLKQNNIPDDFKYLCVAESGLANVVSPAGATGFWQFMKTTGTQYGLTIDTEVDERYNHHKSVVAACKYFNTAYKTFKDWTLVAASYNMGIGGVQKSMESQHVDNYWDLMLNAETARYVFRIISFKLIMENPSAYGFNLEEKDLYDNIETYTITVDTTIDDLTKFALDHNSNLKMLKHFNPWLRSTRLSNKARKEYQIELPKSRTTTSKIPNE